MQSAYSRAITARLAAIKVAEGCQDCSPRTQWPAESLDWLHVPELGAKSFQIGLHGGRSWAAITAERAKCVLVCSGHSRIRMQARRATR